MEVSAQKSFKGFTLMSAALKGKKGFTLIELLIVIAIIAILSIIGITVYNGIQKGARDSRRKEDVLSIAKAYEKNFNGNGSKYNSLAITDFSQGAIPKDPHGEDYFNVVANDGSGYKICAALDVNPSRVCNTPSTNCYCLLASQSNFSSSTNSSTITGTNSSLGLGGGGSSCDPNGTLNSGLVGYWKMDENSWNGTTWEVKDSSGYANNGTAGSGATTTTSGKLSNAGSFNGTGNYVSVEGASSINFGNTSYSFSGWFNTSKNYTAPGDIITNYNGDNPYIYVYIDSLNQFVWESRSYVAPTSSYSKSIATSSTVNDGAWHFFVGVRDTNSGIFFDYLDNNLIGSTSDTRSGTYTSGTNGNRYYFGTEGPNQNVKFFQGTIDDLRIYNRALTTSEINTLWNSGNGCAT